MILDAWDWCSEMTQRDGAGREKGRGFRMGSTCIPVQIHDLASTDFPHFFPIYFLNINLFILIGG